MAKGFLPIDTEPYEIKPDDIFPLYVRVLFPDGTVKYYER